MTIVFLPATDPGDTTYGQAPETIGSGEGISVFNVRFPRLVWYNEAVRSEAIRQIKSCGLSDIVLVGFSKSGLGAWNIARTIPELISATIIFDSPVSRKTLPPWGTSEFYGHDDEWLADLPLNTIDAFITSVEMDHKLVLITGEGFHSEMLAFSAELLKHNFKHTLISRPNQAHHWASGWIELGLNALSRPSPTSGQ